MADVSHAGAAPLAGAPALARTSRAFRWAVFALTFGLLLSDYMSRQVIAAIFPVLKAQWALSDTALATLNSVVSLSVAVLAVPLSVVGDRVGRARSVLVMALVWSVATLASGFAASYGQILLSRVVVGVGEAAYGSLGLAVLLTVFPASRRSTITGTFLAGSSVGSVLGVVIGGAVAQALGWRAAFIALGVAGLVLAGLYAAVITDRRLQAHADPAHEEMSATESLSTRSRFTTLVSTPAVILAYLASGFGLMMTGAMYAWLPSFFARSYHLPTAKAASYAGLVIAVTAVGMIVNGHVADRLALRERSLAWVASMGFVTTAAVALAIAFRMPTGAGQIAVLCLGGFFSAGIAGPAGAMVANLTAPSVRATAFAALSLANNLLGLAAGPLIVGALADRWGLTRALATLPVVAVLVLLLLLGGRATFRSSLLKVGALPAPAST